MIIHIITNFRIPVSAEEKRKKTKTKKKQNPAGDFWQPHV